MWQMRLFGKGDYDYSDDDDTRDQWTPLFEVSGNELYNDVDKYTVKCKVKFNNGENVLLAYGDTIMMFGYITRSRTIVADAQYEYEVSEYLNMLTKYPVPRFGTVTFKQIANKSTSMRSRIDNFSYPGGKKTLQEIMDVVMTGAGGKWAHEVEDYYYDGNSNKDIDGPYFRWEGTSSPSSGYFWDRWYNIPKFTQAPGAYGQLPTPPNVDLKVDGRELVKVLTTADDDMWNQVAFIPWMADEEDTTPDASLATFKKNIIQYFPTMELCATTVFSAIKRLLIDICKMNAWCDVKYKGGDFTFEAVEGESIEYVSFTVKYGYARDHKVGNALQYIQYRSDDRAEDTDVECVLVFGYDHTKDVGMAVKSGSTVPYKTIMWEYKDGRNEGELDAMANQIMQDYQRSKLAIEVDLKPGPALYEESRIHVGDVIRIQCNDIVDYHKLNGWYDGSNTRYAKRMNTLVNWGYLSNDYSDSLFTVKAIRYSISKTILELSEVRKDIFTIMGDKLVRIEGTSQEYDIDSISWRKADLQLLGRPAGEYPYTNIDDTSADYGNIKLIASKPSSASGVPSSFVTWDGTKWINAVEYTGNNYPAWTQLLIMIKPEKNMPEIPDSRGMVPLSYIGPWFNIELKVLGLLPSTSFSAASSGMDYNNVSVGNAWVIPYVYDANDAMCAFSSQAELQALVDEGKYEFPDAFCGLSDLDRHRIYFESETDCLLEHNLRSQKSSGAAGVGCMNYVKIGPIPKGFDSISVTSSISFLDQCFGESNNTAATLDTTISGLGITPKSLLTFNFQWCLDVNGRPRDVTRNEVDYVHGYVYPDGSVEPDIWEPVPDSIYGGKWTETLLTPTWSSGYAIQTAILHNEFLLTNKRLETIVEDASLYLRYVVLFDSYRSSTVYMFNFLAMAGWSVSVTCTPGYELLLEWYKTRTHKIQMMIEGCGTWNKNGSNYKGPISVIIDWPNEDFMNDEGYFCFDIRKFLGEGANYVRLRSIKEISSGVFSAAEVDIRARFISGWIKD
jgi:hypothetical protein